MNETRISQTLKNSKHVQSHHSSLIATSRLANGPKASKPLLETVQKSRCAIYARVSTDERLDQEFNSIDAQVVSARAYIESQRHTGWTPHPDQYIDPGYSGGSLDRPGLHRLVHDIERGLIDIVVVYKIDRLTRSLADFSKLVEIFDQHKVSFVSVTQQFNTTTSMGRLTLNILLSFAQFEREVTGERIRDKIALSKARGIWTGGLPPLGYDVVDQRLVINETEAELVREIFHAYSQHGSSARIAVDLNERGITTKSHISRQGRRSGGRPFNQQILFSMLRNPIYRGHTVHRQSQLEDTHAAIIDEGVWLKVQSWIQKRAMGTRPLRTDHQALLTGLLYNAQGELMIHTYTRKKSGKMYRYYVSSKGKKIASQKRQTNIQANEIEEIVVELLLKKIDSKQYINATLHHLKKKDLDLDEPSVVAAFRNLRVLWDKLLQVEQRRIAELLIDRIQFEDDQLKVVWNECDSRIVTEAFAGSEIRSET